MRDALDMLDFSFLPHIDNFEYYSGRFPILITGDHAGCPSSQSICDAAVSAILSQLAGEFYVIENKVDRNIIDMNRSESRLNDENNENDYFYRQTIRFICETLQKNYSVIPIVIDLHSFDTHPTWGNPDIVLLEQTKTGMKSNPSLLCFTRTFFQECGWKLIISAVHNQDDVVEELASKKMAIPLLIEVNEHFLKDQNAFDQFILDLIEYLHNLASMNRYTTYPDAGVHLASELKTISLGYIQDQKALLPRISNIRLRQKYSQYLRLLEQAIRPLVQNSDGPQIITTLEALGQKASQLSNKGNDDSIIIKHIKI